MKEITLPSGAKATIEPFKGKHVKEAMRNVADSSNSAEIVFSLIALLTTIDGKKIVPEELDEMDGMDTLMLMGEFTGANFRD